MSFRKRGGVIWACTPCVQSRGYRHSDLLEGVSIVGASAKYAQIKEDAATLSFLSGTVALEPRARPG